MAIKRKISAVVPVRNAAAVLAAAVGRLTAELAAAAEQYEIVLVDDASGDGTAEIAADLASRQETVRLVRHERSQGYGVSLREGLAASKLSLILWPSPALVCRAGDLATLMAALEGRELVIGYHRQPRSPLSRRLGSRVRDAINEFLFGAYLRESDHPCRLLRRRILQYVTLESRSGFAMVELLAKVNVLGYGIGELDFDDPAAAATAAPAIPTIPVAGDLEAAQPAGQPEAALRLYEPPDWEGRAALGEAWRMLHHFDLPPDPQMDRARRAIDAETESQ